MKHSMIWLIPVGVGLLLARPSAEATMTYSETVLADNPYGYYRMNETAGTTALDATTPAENGAYQNGVTLGLAGPQQPAFPAFEANNTATKYDGADDQTEITTLTSLNNSTYSYEVWFNYTFDGNLKYFGGRGSGASLQYDAVGIAGSQLLFFNGAVAAFSGFNVPQNSWHHLVYTRDNTAVRVYVDAVERINTVSAITYGTSDRIVAGNRPGDSVFFDGRLDELAIYNTTLTPEQVSAHYLSAFNIPEPSTVGLLALGGGLAWRRRRRCAASSQ